MFQICYPSVFHKSQPPRRLCSFSTTARKLLFSRRSIMAEVPVEQLQADMVEKERLKYLDFVHVAAIQAMVCFTKLYDLAKENSGPLKPGVQSVEGTVKAVVGPVYDKFHDVPYELLKFVDRKVGDSVSELDRHVPLVVKKAPEVARSVAGEVQSAGVVGTATGLAKVAVAKCEPTAKDLYAKYEPVAEQYAVSGWKTLNRFPLFPQVAQVAVPTAAYWSEKYNGLVFSGREKGYTVANYLLPVPTEKIAKVFGPVAAGDPALTTQ